MVTSSSRLPSILRTPIHLGDAKARGLRGAFGVDPDSDDFTHFAAKEIRARVLAFDRHFGLNSSDPKIAEQRVKAMIAYKYGIPMNDPHWWGKLSWTLFNGLFHGFSIKAPNARKQGKPKKWTLALLDKLYHACQTERAKHPRMSESQICIRLPKTNKQDWGQFKGAALRKAYTMAKKMQPNTSFPSILKT
jgi:hypothetical protein